MAIKNYAETYTPEQAATLALRIIEETHRDLEDRREWDEKCEIWTKLWACEPPDRNNPIWEGSANVVVPLVASASEQAHERGYAAYFDQPTLDQVRGLPVEPGDIERALRVELAMNWQVGIQIEEFEPEHDALLASLPYVGVGWKKWWWDEEEDRPCTMFIPGAEVIVPYNTRPYHIRKAPRITHRYRMHASEIEEKVRDGFFVLHDKTLKKQVETAEEVGGQPITILGGTTSNGDIDSVSPAEMATDTITGHSATHPETELHTLFERHERLRLPDGTRIHAIVWVDQTDERVLRITSREAKGKVVHQFVDYHFIRSPYGFYSYGYGHFLGPLNEIANVIFNIGIDSGLVANIPFVFYTPGAGFRKRRLRLKPGDAVPVRDINQVKIEKMAGLDGSLFQLLQIIDHYGSDVSNNTEEARGRVQKGVREPTVRGQQGRLEQSLMGFGVKIKRMISSTKREFQILYNLNSLYLSEKLQHRILGSTDEVAFSSVDVSDFEKKLDVVPTASPAYSSRSQIKQETVELAELLLKMPNAGAPNPQTGAQALPDLMNALLKKLVSTYQMSDLSRYIPAPPPAPLEPGMEQQGWLEGRVADVSEKEDLLNHLTEHRIFVELHGHELKPEVLTKVWAHIKKTQLLLAARQQIQLPPPQPMMGTQPPGPPQSPGIPGTPAPGGNGSVVGPGANENRPTDFNGQAPMVG